MVDATLDEPHDRRSTDGTRRERLGLWWGENWMQVVVFVLLLIIVAGEANDALVDDPAQRDREDRFACVVDNLSASGAESLRRLRAYGPTLDAARKIIAAGANVDEQRAAVEELRRADVPTFDADDLPTPRDCDRD